MCGVLEEQWTSKLRGKALAVWLPGEERMTLEPNPNNWVVAVAALVAEWWAS